MTRRYGRNQKRRARAAIEQLEQAVASERTAHGNTISERGMLRQEIADARAVLGDDHPVFRSPWRTEQSMYPVFQVEVLDRRDRAVFSGDRSPNLETLKFERVHVLRSELLQDTLDRQLHLRVLLGNEGTYGYALSWTALKTLPRQVLARRIALELAEMIVRDLQGVGRG